MNRNVLVAALPSFMLVIVAFIILYFGWNFYNQANQSVEELNTRIESFELNEDLITDGVISSRELQAIQTRVEASEQRALEYLGFYEALGFALTVGGLIVATIGAVAASFGLRNYNEIVTELDETRKEYENAKRQIAENEEESTKTLNKLNSSREDIKRELESSLRKDWENSHLALSQLPLAESQYKLGNVDGALSTYERAIQLDVSNPVPYYYQGYILTQKNQLDKAEIALRKALELDDKFLHAQAALGYTLRRLGEKQADAEQKRKHYDEASTLLKTALAANERLVDADGESWFGSLAGLYKRIGQSDQAEYYYKEAEKVTPLSSYPAVNLAIIALERSSDQVNERFERVAHLAERTILAVQEDYWSYGDLLMAQLALGKHEEAEKTLQTFIEIIPAGVNDVLPRVKQSIEFLRSAASYKNDKRDHDDINQVLADLDAKIHPN